MTQEILRELYKKVKDIAIKRATLNNISFGIKFNDNNIHLIEFCTNGTFDVHLITPSGDIIIEEIKPSEL